jgi:hypothetical protein
MDFCEIDTGDFYKNLSRNSKFGSNKTKYQALCMKTHTHFIVPGDINSRTNAFLCNTKYFYIGDVAQQHTESTDACSLQQ